MSKRANTNRSRTQKPPNNDLNLMGLSSEEAAKRFEQYGQNTLPEALKTSLWLRFFKQFQNPLIYILLFALIFDFGVWFFNEAEGIPLEALAIFAILLLNAVLGVFQEYRAESALDKLKNLTIPLVWVFRDGKLTQTSSTNLVPGDVVRLEAGNRIPADGLMLSSEGFLVDESVLTGESLPVDKNKDNEVFAGTLAQRGQAYIEITRTGQASATGQLAEMLHGIKLGETPLEKRLKAFGSVVARWVIALAILLVLAGIAIEGLSNFTTIFLFAVALAVAAVPEGLPAVLTLTLALGTERMAKRKAVVRRLSAVEALGSVTIIATDKTGTVTENQMYVRTLDSTDRNRALKTMILASDVNRDAEVGDPLELALLHYAEKEGLDSKELIESCPHKSTRPFDAQWKFMRITVTENEKVISYLKGAPEVILERSTMTETQRDNWQEKITAYGSEGYRTLALAWTYGEQEENLNFLGLVLLWDPPRPEVLEAVKQAQEAGIRVLMITGDHPATALAIAQEVGISSSRVLTDVDLGLLEPSTLSSVMKEVNVFARVKPEHKLKIVKALKTSGEVVAMTGDGVNDAPALKDADVGVAMGKRGSDVAREVADIVLLDDNFATIVAAVEEGRSIYSNIQKFIRFLFTTNLAEVLIVVLGVLAAFLLNLRDIDGSFLLPLTAAQILWINLITDSLPALALAMDKNPAAMKNPPQAAQSALLDKASIIFIVFSGSLLTLLVLVTLGILPNWGFSTDQTRSVGFMILVLAQLLYAFSARRLSGSSPINLYLIAAVAICFGLQFTILAVPNLRGLLDVVPFSSLAMFWVIVGTLIAWLISDSFGRFLARS